MAAMAMAYVIHTRRRERETRLLHRLCKPRSARTQPCLPLLAPFCLMLLLAPELLSVASCAGSCQSELGLVCSMDGLGADKLRGAIRATGTAWATMRRYDVLHEHAAVPCEGEVTVV